MSKSSSRFSAWMNIFAPSTSLNRVKSCSKVLQPGWKPPQSKVQQWTGSSSPSRCTKLWWSLSEQFTYGSYSRGWSSVVLLRNPKWCLSYEIPATSGMWKVLCALTHEKCPAQHLDQFNTRQDCTTNLVVCHGIKENKSEKTLPFQTVSLCGKHINNN